jgi:hypothetical protein
MSCATYQLERGLDWCNPPSEPITEASMDGGHVQSAFHALTVFEADRELFRLKVNRAGSTLESFGVLLVQIVFVFGVVEAITHHAVVPTRILVALLIVGFGYWLTIRELRRKAEARIGL